MYHTVLVSEYASNSAGRIEALGPGKPGDLCLSLTKDWGEINRSYEVDWRNMFFIPNLP